MTINQVEILFYCGQGCRPQQHAPLTSMSIFLWNYKGIRRLDITSYLNGIVKNFNPLCIILMETKKNLEFMMRLAIIQKYRIHNS